MDRRCLFLPISLASLALACSVDPPLSVTPTDLPGDETSMGPLVAGPKLAAQGSPTIAVDLPLGDPLRWNPFQGAADLDVGCTLQKCFSPMAQCASEAACREALDCVRNCSNETGEAKQRCTIACVETKGNERFGSLSSCLMREGCVPRPAPFTCPVPSPDAPLAAFTLADLEGDWYVLRGLSRTYDCWDCQRMSFEQVDPTRSRYAYTYDVGNQARNIPCEVTQGSSATATPPIKTSPGSAPTPSPESPGRFSVRYTAHGVEGLDDWYVLLHPSPDLALIYYCGASPADTYRGAVIVARRPDRDLSPDETTALQKALDGAGLPTPPQLSEFCSPRIRDCSFGP